jgi:hypothetical protein
MTGFGLYDTLTDTRADGGLTLLRFSPPLATAIETELQRLLKRAVDIVGAEVATAERLADELLHRQVLSAPEIDAILAVRDDALKDGDPGAAPPPAARQPRPAPGQPDDQVAAGDLVSSG